MGNSHSTRAANKSPAHVSRTTPISSKVIAEINSHSTRAANKSPAHVSRTTPISSKVKAEMSSLTITNSKATVVVALDFGTTFSGFAFARMSEPDEVHKFYDWPDLRTGGGANYCKTLTSLLYKAGEHSGSYVLQDWGYTALIKYLRGNKTQQSTLHKIGNYGEDTFGSTHQRPAVFMNELATGRAIYYITLFKLHLASSEAGRLSASELPAGLTVRTVISDYLRNMSVLIMEVLRGRLGKHITKKDVQWCLTVPAMWDERGKQEMKTCAEIAGLVTGPDCPSDAIKGASPHQIMIVLEPEAASLYCQQKVQLPLSTGDKILIVDVGGGTVDLVLHEKVGPPSSRKVREVSSSKGGLCGGSYVDKAFFHFLANRISCFRAFFRQHPDSILKLQGWWENIKCGFDGNMHFSYELELPARLAHAWEEDDRLKNQISDPSFTYDSIELSLEDMLGIFDPVVNQILDLIEQKWIANLKSMMIVGGFSGSPYLVKRIRQVFSPTVGSIVVPDEPGSAICCGAVVYGIYGGDIITSRISRKTYGISKHQLINPTELIQGDRPVVHGDDERLYYPDCFSVFTKKGDEVPFDHCVCRIVHPLRKMTTRTRIGLYSTIVLDPKSVRDPRVTEEGGFVVSHPSESKLGRRPEMLVSMHFGRTTVEVTAEGKNFGNGEKFRMPPVRFEKSHI